MSATLEAPARTTTAEAESTSSLLHDIIHRVDAIGVAQQRPSPVHLRTWEEIERFAEKAARSGMVPKDYIGKPDAICIAVQMGSELGLAPMQAIQNIAVVNGRPAIWGDAIPGLCRASGKCRSIREWSEGEGDAETYYCEAIRTDDPHPVRARFSVADAKKANLWKDKPTVTRKSRDGGTYEADSGPWYSYPQRMLQMRARGFGLRDAFPDVLKGLITAEEARDIPFEATGLTPTAPATQADRAYSAHPNPNDDPNRQPTDRDRINAAVPLQSMSGRAAASATPRGARIAERAPAYEAPPKPEPLTADERRWLDAFERDCFRAKTEVQANVILTSRGVLEAERVLAPEPLARFLAIRDALIAHFWPQPPDEPTEDVAKTEAAADAWPGDELAEVEIVGAEKIAAGD